jgi:hypothetical protein
VVRMDFGVNASRGTRVTFRGGRSASTAGRSRMRSW